MTDEILGRLERVDLREIWTSEASQFTPWLARQENLSILGDALGIELEFEAQEKSVGPFRADILCKDISTDRWVLIENQLERTDHTHLGQLLTYAAGLDAVTIVWVAKQFTEEHRAVLDWLNKITDASCNFFGLEVELWRIGLSPAAPKFNIVSKPNDWSHSVANAARTIDDEETSELKTLQRQYWTDFQTVLAAMNNSIAGNRKPQPSSWMGYRIGRSGFRICAVMLRPRKAVRAELYMTGEHAKAMFHLLHQQKDAIEHELGYALEWEELPGRLDSRIAIYLREADPENTEDWPRQHAWLARHVSQLHRVFVNRVRELDEEDWRPEVT